MANGSSIPTLSAPPVFAADGFNAGVATTDITPPVGWRRAGNYTEFTSTGVHDPLFAKAMVLSPWIRL